MPRIYDMDRYPPCKHCHRVAWGKQITDMKGGRVYMACEHCRSHRVKSELVIARTKDAPYTEYDPQYVDQLEKESLMSLEDWLALEFERRTK